MSGRAGQCAACSHADARELNEALVRGVSVRDAARQFRLKPGVVARHEREHIPKVLALDRAEKDRTAARSLKDIFNALFERLEGVIQRCETAGDWRAVIVALREQREWVQDAVKMRIGGSEREVTFHVVYDNPLPGDPSERNQLPARVEPTTEPEVAEAEPPGRAERAAKIISPAAYDLREQIQAHAVTDENARWFLDPNPNASEEELGQRLRQLAQSLGRTVADIEKILEELSRED